MSLVIATYLWADPASTYTYTPDDVYLLRRMVARHLTVPHEFVCITDRPWLFAGSEKVRAVQLIQHPKAPTGHCLQRLMTFHPHGKELIGERVFQMDLDTIVVGNMDEIVSRGEDVVLWRNPARVPWRNPRQWKRPFYNGSFVLHRCGSKPEVWDYFNPRDPASRDDQTWYSRWFGDDAPYWDGSDGVYRLPRDDTPDPLWVAGKIPANARVVTFPGSEGKPTNPRILAAHPWIVEHRC